AESQERRAHTELLDGIDAVVWEAHPHPEDGLRVEGRCEVLLGRTAGELAAPGAWDELIEPDTRERVVERRRRLITAGRDHESTYPVRTPSGRVRHLRERVRVGVDADGRPATARAVVIDVTETVDAAERLRRRALHDELTGLANRALLTERLDHAVQGARRSGSPVALLLLDLDQFKEVNDSLGHDQGDRLLVAVARRLRDHVRESDTLARLGGDEFAVLLERDVTPRTTLQVAERILACFDRPFELDALSLQVGASLGVAIHPEHGTTAADLRRHADTAMYTAKRRGGGLAVYDPGRNRSSSQRLSLLSELRRAIDGGELLVHYQPIVTLSTGRIGAVEALLRWRHPRHGLVSPGEFLDGAEVAGIIRPLTQWVLARALDDLDRWRRAGLDLRLAVNVSVRNLYETTFADDVRRLLAAHDVDPSRLTLELTETQVVDDLARAHTALTGLTALGVGIAIDDFGTGHSSLTNLHALDVDEVKIDRSFVAAMEAGDATAETIVRSIISLARSLGLEVVAEGVESPDTVTRLSLLGCDRAQGFWFARPRPADDLVEFVTDHNRALDRPRGPAGEGHDGVARVGRGGGGATLEEGGRVP
ncbi:MAG: EAL domain-containing protein, partial [Actinomyces sp.]